MVEANIKYALMDENARMLEKGETATPKTEKEEFLQILRDLVRKYEKEEIKALCFSAPGRIDSKTGYFHVNKVVELLLGFNHFIHEEGIYTLRFDCVPLIQTLS